MEDQVKEIMADVLKLDASAIDDSTSMDNTANWDSMHHIDLCLALEQEFGMTLSVEEMESMISFFDIMDMLQHKVSA